MFFNEMGREGLNCVSLSQATGRQWAVVKIVMYLQFPYSAGGLLDCWILRRTLIHIVSELTEVAVV